MSLLKVKKNCRINSNNLISLLQHIVILVENITLVGTNRLQVNCCEGIWSKAFIKKNPVLKPPSWFYCEKSNKVEILPKSCQTLYTCSGLMRKHSCKFLCKFVGKLIFLRMKK